MTEIIIIKAGHGDYKPKYIQGTRELASTHVESEQEAKMLVSIGVAKWPDAPNSKPVLKTVKKETQIHVDVEERETK